MDPALAYLREIGAPIVVKADGLAAGKGVTLAEDLATAERTVRDMLKGERFGAAGHRVVIQQVDGDFPFRRLELIKLPTQAFVYAVFW